MLLTAVRFALAIVLDVLALTVWDVGTRPPPRLLRDAVNATRTPAALVSGALRFGAGLALLLLGAFIASRALPGTQLLVIGETGLLIVALLVEQLVGPDLRARARRR